MQNAEFWAVHLSDCFLICIHVEADALSSTDAGPSSRFNGRILRMSRDQEFARHRRDSDATVFHTAMGSVASNLAALTQISV
jgi:hypothetical protein